MKNELVDEIVDSLIAKLGGVKLSPKETRIIEGCGRRISAALANGAKDREASRQSIADEIDTLREIELAKKIDIENVVRKIASAAIDRAFDFILGKIA